MPEIIVKFDNKVVERVVTEKERISIGRTSDNDIVLDNRGVSRKHARIEFNGNEAILIDNESLNGTFVNQRKVTEEKLRDKDTITIGKFDLIFSVGATSSDKMSDHDGTMILNTKRQKEMIKQDREAKEMIKAVGCSVLLGVENVSEAEVPLDREVLTIGKSKYVNVNVGGWMVSGIQAKIIKEDDNYVVRTDGPSPDTASSRWSAWSPLRKKSSCPTKKPFPKSRANGWS